MPTITSNQSGNFSATTTWVGGAVPVDGDSFVIASGHTVTYDVVTPVTTGFQDSNISGTLQTLSGTATTLRMNGRLNILTNGTYHARSGHRLQFRGTMAESHILYQQEVSGSKLIMEGSDGMPTTTLSSAANENSTSFSFTSTTNFAPGEWFAIYNNTTAQTLNAGPTTLRDEGFWIHDIVGTTVYFREFVGPDSNITAFVGSTITVGNSKVFRAGQRIIFGTNSAGNLNVKTISSINYSTHVITCDSAITGNPTGVTVYETASNKIHAAGDKVRKVATITTASSTSTATTITVANSNQFVANDEIWIEARSECGGTTDRAYNAYGTDSGPRYRHVVTSVVGNVVTLNAQIGYNVVQGALVTRLTRDVVVEPVTPNVDYYGVWCGSYTTDYTRKLILKDVQFRYVGSAQGQPEGGVTIRGYFSTNAPGVTLNNTVPSYNQQPWVEGLSLTGSNSTRDWGGLWSYGTRYLQFRCCTAVGIFNAGIGLWYDSGHAAYNCIVAGSNTWGMRLEGYVEWGEVAYNYNSRSYYANRIAAYDANCGTHRMICDAITDNVSLPCTNIPLYRWSITGLLYTAPQSERSHAQFVYSRIASASGYTNIKSNPPATYARGYYHAQGDRGNAGQNIATVLEDDFEYDRVRQFAYGTERVWDNTENAWRVVVGVDFGDAWRGWYQTLYIPANTTVIVSCAVKLAPNFVGTYPYLAVLDLQSGIGFNQLGNAGGMWSSCLSGGGNTANYTAQATNSYETVQITISPVSWQRFLNVGVANTNQDASEGWWMKPIQVTMNSSYATPALEVANVGPGMPLERLSIGNSVVQNIIRIGGTRLN
jgi:hypothetical protein